MITSSLAVIRSFSKQPCTLFHSTSISFHKSRWDRKNRAKNPSPPYTPSALKTLETQSMPLENIADKLKNTGDINQRKSLFNVEMRNRRKQFLRSWAVESLNAQSSATDENPALDLEERKQEKPLKTFRSRINGKLPPPQTPQSRPKKTNELNSSKAIDLSEEEKLVQELREKNRLEKDSRDQRYRLNGLLQLYYASGEFVTRDNIDQKIESFLASGFPDFRVDFVDKLGVLGQLDVVDMAKSLEQKRQREVYNALHGEVLDGQPDLDSIKQKA